MKNYLIAAILTIHSFAFAAPTGVTTGSNEGVNNVVDEKAGTSRERLDRTVESIPNSKYSGSKYSGDMSRAQGGQIAQDHELSRLVSKASTIKLAELIDTRDQVFKIIETLNAINEDNEKDPVLRYANRIQAGLALATSITLGAHLNSIEKRRFLLSISAGAAVMTSLTRFYKSRANLTDHDVSKVLQRFTRQLMLNKKALTPEMQELVKEISDMSSKVLYTQSAFDKLIDGTGDASYVSTVIIVGLAIAHWISPKVAAEAEDALKMVSLRMGEFAKGLGQFANESKITVGAGGAVSVLPEVIGNAMGLSTESSKKLIASTVNDLTKATINFQKQIDFIADGRSQLDPNKR